jgi:hypothetical protein
MRRKYLLIRGGPQIKGTSVICYVLPWGHIIMRTSLAGLYSCTSSGYALSHFFVFVVVLYVHAYVQCDTSGSLICEDVTIGHV